MLYPMRMPEFTSSCVSICTPLTKTFAVSSLYPFTTPRISYVWLLKLQNKIGPPEKPGLLNPSMYNTTASGFVWSMADIVPLFMNGMTVPLSLGNRLPIPPNGYPMQQAMLSLRSGYTNLKRTEKFGAKPLEETVKCQE